MVYRSGKVEHADNDRQQAFAAEICWCQAVGNLIVAGVAEIDISNIANEFLLYAVLMTVVTLSFVIVASFYEYRDYGSQDLALEVEESSADTNDSLCVDEDGVSQQETVESEDHEGTDSILFERTSNPL